MRRNRFVKFGSVVLAAAVLLTGTWYVNRETEDLTVPQMVEYIDTEDGTTVIEGEEVPLASKPVVKVQTSTKKKVKKTKMKKKSSKSKKTTKTTKKSSTSSVTSSSKKVRKDTTVQTKVVTALKKNSKVKTVTTTVKTTVKTTTTPKSSETTTVASESSAAVVSTSSGSSSKTSTASVRSLAPKADEVVLSAFEKLEFKIEINPSLSGYVGLFSVKSHSIKLKKTDAIYHELGHFVGWLAGNVDTVSEFVQIYNKEKSALKSLNAAYLTKDSAEYFAESYKDYVLSPSSLKSSRPQTYAYIEKSLKKITDARVTAIKAACASYWSQV